jgi:hypothetical protein
MLGYANLSTLVRSDPVIVSENDQYSYSCCLSNISPVAFSKNSSLHAME